MRNIRLYRVKYQTLTFVEANKLLINHAFEQLNMNRIYGGTMSKDGTKSFCEAIEF